MYIVRTEIRTRQIPHKMPLPDEVILSYRN